MKLIRIPKKKFDQRSEAPENILDAYYSTNGHRLLIWNKDEYAYIEIYRDSGNINEDVILKREIPSKVWK